MDVQKAMDKAVELGATIREGGISWIWADGFPSLLKAQEFVDWLDANEFEHRGVYEGNNTPLCDVRFR